MYQYRNSHIQSGFVIPHFDELPAVVAALLCAVAVPDGSSASSPCAQNCDLNSPDYDVIPLSVTIFSSSISIYFTLARKDIFFHYNFLLSVQEILHTLKLMLKRTKILLITYFNIQILPDHAVNPLVGMPSVK